ncbi:MAG: M48 family metalloprotease [Verrucomicrobiota bacterium]|nr:M48 family metalloprotease [Verrucomicrobiota bacterium]
MDFFDRQNQTKKKTARLVFYFIIAVLLVSLLNHLLLSLSMLLIGLLSAGEDYGHDILEFGLSFLMDPRFIGLVTFFTFCFICLAALIRMYQLKNGSTSLALAMGGRFVSPSTTDPKERQLLNVVEEMAIASSVPVPNVFVLDNEMGINAMALGSSVSDSVVLVTSGFLRQLNRQEAQGVIGHEFSHILNEDMKINMRMVVMIHGMLMLRSVGNFLISGIGSRTSDEGGSHPALVAVGTAFIVTGSVGSELAGLIKSAVSRQREYLADASAVQFTRNPLGLAGALKKIGAHKYGSRVRSYKTEEVSHMFFGSSLRGVKARLSSTHPPLLERIKHLDPTFDGDFTKVKVIEDSQGPPPEPPDITLVDAVSSGDIDAVHLHIDAGTDLNQKDDSGSTPVVVAALHGHKEITKVLLDENEQTSGYVRGVASQEFNTIPSMDGELGQGSIQTESASQLTDTIGNPTIEHIDFASVLLRYLPEIVKEAAHDTHDACALIFALLLDKRENEVQQKQLARVQDVFGEHMAKAAGKLHDEVLRLDSRVKLPLVDLALGSLKQLAPDQFSSFKYLVDDIISADQAIDLFEFSLSKLVIRHLQPHFNGGRKKVSQVYSLKRLGDKCSVLISAIANVAGSDEQAKQEAFDAGRAHLMSKTEVKFLPHEQCGLQQLDNALIELNRVTLKLKRLLIQAAAASISADGYLQIQEAEMLRAISDSLDCPMPPLAIDLDTAA